MAPRNPDVPARQRILITGLWGQDGTLLAKRLLERGVEVHGLVRASEVPPESAPMLPGACNTGSPPRTPHAPAEHGIQVHVGDLLDLDGLVQLVSHVAPDAIVNLAAISSVGYSWDHPAETGAVTGQGAVNVFEAAWRFQEKSGHPVRVVHASSSEIFGSPDICPQDEDTPISPVSPYGAAKAYAHLMARAYRKKGLAVTALILYGHESTLRPPTFVSRKITKGAVAVARGELDVLKLGNLEAMRDWGWAPDYVEAMQIVAGVGSNDAPEPGEFVIATGEPRTVGEFVAAAFRAAGIENWEDHVEVDPQFFRPADPVALSGNPSRARNILGWMPSMTFEQIVSAMVAHDMALAKDKVSAHDKALAEDRLADKHSAQS